MKDIYRIVRIVMLIFGLWLKKPESSLCQVISNCLGMGTRNYIDDDELERKLKIAYQKTEIKK